MNKNFDLKKLNFCFFGFNEINTFLKNGKEKKLLNTRSLPTKEERNKLTPENSYYGNYSTAIITGKQSDITVIDCDSQKVYDFLLGEYPDFINYYTVKTNKGYHIYCSYCHKVKTSTNEELEIDIRNDGGIIIAPPTRYTLLNGSIFQYSYIGGSKLGEFPEFLIKLLGSSEPKPKPQPHSVITDVIVESDFLCPIQDNYNCLPFLNMLSKKHWGNYEDWIKLGCIIYSLDLPCICWDHFSRRSSKYEEGECDYWSTFTSKRYTIGTLFYLCKNDNPVEYTRLKKQYNFNLVFDEPIESENIEYYNIEERYLLNKDGDNYTIKESIDTHMNRLFNDPTVSSLNIKSPYGTSKTQLLIKSVQKYEPRKILFLSYRKSLNYDLQNNFDKLAFGNYLELLKYF